MGDVIYIHRQEMSGEELLMRYRLVIDSIKTVRKLNPPLDCAKTNGEFTNQMNKLLLDLIDIKKKLEKNVELYRKGSLK